MKKVHFVVAAKWRTGIEVFACGRIQQIIVLDATYDPSRVTCLACLKRMKPPYASYLTST